MIVPNCRQHITARDLAFALETVKGSSGEGAGVIADEIDVDELLDSRELFEALLRSQQLLAVSPWFFYYVLVRQVFLERGISERSVADYVGALLSYFLERSRLGADAGSAPRSFVYLVDLIQAVQAARSAQAAFVMEARIGDVALFLTGVFPDAIYHRQVYGRRLPGLDYYESVGRSGYRAAASHAPARHAGLGELLGLMASQFADVRRALNELSDTHFGFGSRNAEPLDRLLRQALWSQPAESRDGELERDEDDV